VPPLRPRRTVLRSLPLAALVGLGTLSAAVAESSPAKAPPSSSRWDLAEFIDELPDLLADRLPSFDRTGSVRLYVRPHFGDFLHRDYVRVPVGARAKINDKIESSAELQGYFTHGISDPAGYGLSHLKLGTKVEKILPSLNDGGISVGFNYVTPLSRPPIDLSDGHRHFQPYVAAARPIMPAWRLLGYASVSADFLDRTALPAHFGRNQLHTNSLMFSVGAAREWTRFRTAVTASVTTSSLLSNEHQNVYALRPEIVMPWKGKPGARSQILLTLGGRAIHGPDGTELGLSTSVRIDFRLQREGTGK